MQEGHGRPQPLSEASPLGPRHPGHSCRELELWETLSVRGGGEQGLQACRGLNLVF